MSKQESYDPIIQFNNLLPEWGQAADEIYQNYHFLTLALNQNDNFLIPEEASNQLIALRELLINTIGQLIQDLPPSTYRLSNENGESIHLFNTHTNILKAINLHTDTLFQDLVTQYPPLSQWLESISDE